MDSFLPELNKLVVTEYDVDSHVRKWRHSYCLCQDRNNNPIFGKVINVYNDRLEVYTNTGTVKTKFSGIYHHIPSQLFVVNGDCYALIRKNKRSFKVGLSSDNSSVFLFSTQQNRWIESTHEGVLEYFNPFMPVKFYRGPNFTVIDQRFLITKKAIYYLLDKIYLTERNLHSARLLPEIRHLLNKYARKQNDQSSVPNSVFGVQYGLSATDKG